MPTRMFLLSILLYLAPVMSAWASGSMLRVTCDGDNQGANVTVNGKFKGQCPLDISISEGILKLSAEKKFGDEYRGTYGQEIRIGDGVVQRIEIVLIKNLTESGRKLAMEKSKALLDAYEHDKTEYGVEIVKRAASVAQCVSQLEVSAQAKGDDCYRNSGGCVGGLWCEAYKARYKRCYGSEDRSIDTRPFEASCEQKFRKPPMPVAPVANLN